MCKYVQPLPETPVTVDLSERTDCLSDWTQKPHDYMIQLGAI